jgi:hypothetical protein
MGFGGHYVLDKGFTAGTALTQFRCVTLASAADTVEAVDNVADQVIGICQETISAGDATNKRVANIALLGVSLAEAGAAVTKGSRVKTDSVGRVIDVVAGAGLQNSVGIALAAAGAAGDWIPVLLTPAGSHNTATT